MCYQSVRKETESMGGFIILTSDSSSQEKLDLAVPPNGNDCL